METRKGGVEFATLLIFLFAIAAGWFAADAFLRRRELAVWKDEYKVLQDSAVVWKSRTVVQAAKVDTVIKTVRTIANRTTLTVDTLEVPVTELVKDTAWAQQMVRDAIELRGGCLELAVECDQFKLVAESRFRNYDLQIAKLEAKPERSCVMWFVVGGAAGAGGTIALQGAFR